MRSNGRQCNALVILLGCWLSVVGNAADDIASLPTAISADYCADQFLLALAERSQILAVSPDADAPFSYLAERAMGLPKLNASVEELVALEPDFIITSWGWSERDRQLPERLGTEFVQVAFGDTPESIASGLRQVGAALGREDRAEQLVNEMYQRLARVDSAIKRRGATPLTAVYLTPSGTTSGTGTLVDEIITRAGLINGMAQYVGWQQLRLEELLVSPPDVFVASFFELEGALTDNWNIARHEVMRQMLADRPVVLVPSKQLSCAAWYFVEAVEMLANEVAAPKLLDRQQLRAGGLP